MKLIGSSKTKLYFLILRCSIAMKLSVKERRIRDIVLPQKYFNFCCTISANTFFLIRTAILGYFHRQKPWVLVRVITMRHEIECKICFHFLLEEGLNFRNVFTFVHKSQA